MNLGSPSLTHLGKEDDEGEWLEGVSEQPLKVRDRRVEQLLRERRVRLEGAALRLELQEWPLRNRIDRNSSKASTKL